MRRSGYIILIACILMMTACKTKQKMETALPIMHEEVGEHSPSVLIVMYDQEVGKESLLKAIKEYKAEIVYDYRMMSGMAIKKPANRTLEETMAYFRKVKGVVSVDYDRVIHLTDPVKPKLEIK